MDGGNHFVNRGDDFVDWMNSVSGLDDLSVESGVFVSGVLDCSGGAVRFEQAVGSL